ncbi:hypothetical protein GCM10010123_44040 [Pilimelia anulata]|uniref:Uncharacterized protein n=1 Tax=Pilimelia anulata TaxID=53371 RepID=A0A8J3BGL6_9ACTN|nr:hypothetical protein GCM10010123_44040 [Pilimelia anulata]
MLPLKSGVLLIGVAETRAIAGAAGRATRSAAPHATADRRNGLFRSGRTVRLFITDKP